MQDLRYQFRCWLETIDIRNLVFIDETGINLAMTRLYGRARGGARVSAQCPGNKGENITLIGAMSDEGLIAAMTLPGSLNTPSFLVFLEKVLLPQLWTGAIVVMDNLPVHYAHAAQLLLESVGAQIKFLPPYSPDLSPIELCWSKLKEFSVRLKLAQLRLLMKQSQWLLMLLLMIMPSVGFIIAGYFLSLLNTLLLGESVRKLL